MPSEPARGASFRPKIRKTRRMSGWECWNNSVMSKSTLKHGHNGCALFHTSINSRAGWKNTQNCSLTSRGRTARTISMWFLSRVLDPGQQGGGISAPPPGLGIGACFVVRELLRHGHLHSRYAHEHAFVPTGSVRRLVNRIGLEIDNEASVDVSAQIYAQIAKYLTPQRAIFDGAYDVPLQIIAADRELERQLLDGFP